MDNGNMFQIKNKKTIIIKINSKLSCLRYIYIYTHKNQSGKYFQKYSLDIQEDLLAGGKAQNLHIEIWDLTILDTVSSMPEYHKTVLCYVIFF